MSFLTPEAFMTGGLDSLIANVRGFVIIDMNDDDYVMTDAEAQAEVKAITNSGDGTKTLYYPASSDGSTGATQYIVTFFAGAEFYVESVTGGIPVLLSAPEVDVITYDNTNLPLSLYAGYISNASYSVAWDTSLKAPTQDATHHAIQDETIKQSLLFMGG